MEKHFKEISLIVHRVLKNWSQSSIIDDNLYSEIRSIKDFESIEKFLMEGIEKIAEKNELEAKILLLRFKNKRSIRSVAHELNFSTDQINRLQRKGIEELSKIVLQQERKIKESQSEYFVNQLPVKISNKIFGFEDSINSISERILDIKGPKIITISGLGGIGKTALADSVTRNVLAEFYFTKIIWYRAERLGLISENLENILKHLSIKLLDKEEIDFNVKNLLKKVFISSPHLVVIDNLGISENIEKIIQLFNEIGGISKFIITSRRQPSPMISDSYNHRLDEIGIEEAGELLSNQAKYIGLEAYSDDILSNLESVYENVGGNPLALKLLVGLLDALPLSIVLKDFKNAQLKDIRSMYKYIYMLAWDSLDLNSKKLLVGMQLSSINGFTLENISTYSKLENTDLVNSIQILFDRSLIEKRGSLEIRRFGIHHLTHSFLETDIVEWPPK